MRMSLAVDYGVIRSTQDALRGMPKKVEATFRFAGKKAAEFLAKSIAGVTPVQRRKTKQSKLPHLADLVTVKQRTYRKKRGASVTYFAVGYGSPQKPNAHLVEDGTAQRFTGSRSTYKTVGQKKVKTRKGWVFKRMLKSEGSQRIGGPSINRGAMPAFRPTGNTFATKGQQARQIMLAEIKAKIQRELAASSRRSQKAFGGIGQ